MDFPTALNDVKTSVDKELKSFFLKKRAEANGIHPQTAQLVDQIANLTSRGGKRTRAFLVWLGSQSVIPAKAGIQRKKDRIPNRARLADASTKRVGDDTLLCAMTAVELFQSFALIHDDIIDEDAMRRGSPTVHEQFKLSAISSQLSATNAKHFGESMAILAGDIALVWADELMNNVQYPMTNDQSKLQKNVSFAPLTLYQKMKEEVIFGQSLDVLAAAGLPSADRAAINRYKTAWYSVVRPLQIGAAVAGADEAVIASFVPYGLAVGEGYQLRDDVLDGAISHEEFDAQSAAYEKQTPHAIQTIHASAVTVPLFADFARFALSREK